LSRYSPSVLLDVVDLPQAMPFAMLQGVLVLAWVLPSAVIPIQALELLGNAQTVSVFFFGVGFVGLFGALVAPWLIHVLGRRAMIVLGAGCVVTSSLFLSLDHTVFLIIGTAARALGFLCFDVAFEVAIMERIPRRALARFESVRMFFMGIGLIIGPWLGVRLSVDYGLWCTFTVISVLTVGCCAYILRVRLADSLSGTRAERRPPNPLRFTVRFLRQPRLRLAWVLAFGRSAWWTMFFIYAPIYCVESGLGEEWAGIILSAASVAILLVPLWGRLGQRIGVRALLAIGYMTTALATLTVAAANLAWLGVTFLLAASVFASVIDAVGNALFLRAVRPHERSEMASVFITYRAMAHLVPPGILAALLGFFALPVVFLTSGASMVALTWLTRHIPRRY
jgi:MFS family permease